jgi:hypothetical protein
MPAAEDLGARAISLPSGRARRPGAGEALDG